MAYSREDPSVSDGVDRLGQPVQAVITVPPALTGFEGGCCMSPAVVFLGSGVASVNGLAASPGRVWEQLVK
jgi:hypothetical protein